MRGKKTIPLLLSIGCIFAGMAASCGSRQTAPYTVGMSVQQVVGIPEDEAGFSQGVSACYAGMIEGRMVIAGGCNFPEIAAAEGGKKRFYQGIYVAKPTTDSLLQWTKIGELPVPAAYGVSIPIPGGLILAGGMNADGSLTAVYRLLLSADGRAAVLDSLRSLPFPMDNMAGASVGSSLFLMGGNVAGKPSASLYSFDYIEPGSSWELEAPFPGAARVQPVCVAQDKGGVRVYVWGGFAPSVDGKAATLSTDGYCYSLDTRTWSAVGTPVGNDFESVSLGGGAAYAMNDSTIVCAGGVNKGVFLSALRREEMLKNAVASSDSLRIDSLKAVGKEYMTRPPLFYRFNDKILVYHTTQNVWTEVGSTPAVARAGAALIGDGDTFYSIYGELKPGIRTPEIYKITLE